MAGNINIQVNGSGASFGNVVQGDGNNVGVSISNAEIEKGFALLWADVRREAVLRNESVERLQQLEKRLHELNITAAHQNGDDTKPARSILTELKENFDWIYPVLKDAAEKFLPWLVCLL